MYVIFPQNQMKETSHYIFVSSLQKQMTAYFMVYLTAADSSLGKVDKHSLSQQTLMELLIENIENKDIICGFTEHPKDVSEWEGLKFNEANEVTEINWSNKNLRGPIELKWLPSSVQSAYMWKNKLSGTADLTDLPDGMENLSLYNNLFEGTVDLTKLPSGMKILALSHNNFFGMTDFSALPEFLFYLNIGDTQLMGEISEFKGIFLCQNTEVKDRRQWYIR